MGTVTLGRVSVLVRCRYAVNGRVGTPSVCAYMGAFVGVSHRGKRKKPLVWYKGPIRGGVGPVVTGQS